MAISPRLARAGLVILTPDGQQVTRVISLQYNPDSVTRSLHARGAAADATGGERQRVSGAATQTISFDAELDATDQLSVAQPTGVEVSLGLHPYLAALEGLLNPPLDRVLANDRLAASGLLEIVGVAAPSLVLVWSRQRVVPVRLTELSIVEDAFDARLNPIRAKVSVSLTVLGVYELGTTSRLGSLAVGHHRNLERLAGARAFGSMADLGQGVEI